MECLVVSCVRSVRWITSLSFLSVETQIFPFFLSRQFPNRAIVVTWFIVTISAIPVGLSHGIVEYTNHKNEINTACLFLTDEGYNHAAFQVRAKRYLDKTNYVNKDDSEMIP